MFFGTGLVKTVEDFGSQGERPSHPELLDWLATELIRSGWDVKSLIRIIVTSARYRQSSRVSRELLDRDPENRLLARGPRLRLSAEMIRDQALALSGLLVERLGGPSVKPYQPPGLWSELGDASYVQDQGPALYRRGLYTFWKRTVAPPSLAAFDAPGRETCTVRESRTNTPLQALVMMNDPTFVEAAQALAMRVMHEGGKTLEERLSWAFRSNDRAAARSRRAGGSRGRISRPPAPISQPTRGCPSPGRAGRASRRPHLRGGRAGRDGRDHADDPQPRRGPHQGMSRFMDPWNRESRADLSSKVPAANQPRAGIAGTGVAARWGSTGPGEFRRRAGWIPQLRPACQAGDLSVPVGRTLADGPVRSQAAARAARVGPTCPTRSARASGSPA